MTNMKKVIKQFDKVIKKENERYFNNDRDFIKKEEQDIRDELKYIKDQLRERLEIIKEIKGIEIIKLDPITSKSLKLIENEDVESMEITNIDTYSEFRFRAYTLISEAEMLLEGPKGLDKRVTDLLSDMIFTLYKYKKVSKEEINETICYRFRDETTFLSLDEKNNRIVFKTVSRIFKEEIVHSQIKDKVFMSKTIEVMINLIDSKTK